MRRPPRFTLALLAAITGCADDGAGDPSATGSAGTTTGSTGTTASAGTTAEPTGTSTTPTTTAGETATATTSTTTATTGSSTTGTGSAGTTSTSTGDTDTGDTGTSTTGGADDPVGAVAPAWLRPLDGLISLAPPRVVPLPDGDVLAMISGGLYAKTIVLAEGGADEVVLPTMYVVPALARFDGASGALEEARLLAKQVQGAPYGISVQTREVRLADDGDVLVAGTWAGSAEFFPGTNNSKAMVAEMKLNGNNLDRAEEPFYYRMTPAGAVEWLIRGQTPPGIQTTWFNYGKGIAALPGGDVVIAGEYELSNFVVAPGTPGAKTLTGTQSSFFARLGATGSPAWVYRNTARLVSYPLKTGADGAIYSLLPADATIFADAPMPTMTAAEPGLKTAVLGRIAGSGGLDWTANIATTGLYPLRNFEVGAGGDLVLFGDLDGQLLVRDSGGVVHDLQTAESEGWIGALDSTGAGLWLRALGPAVSLVGPTLAGDDGVWIVARIAAPYELEVAGEVTPLPALGYPAESSATALLRIDAAGQVSAVQVLGAALWIDSLAWSGADQTAFLVTGAYWCDSTQPHVVSEGGDGLAGLAIGCEMEPLDDQRGFVAAIPRAL